DVEREVVGRGGRCVGEGADAGNYPTARKPSRPQARARQLHEQPDPPLPKNERLNMKTIGFDQPLYILPFDHRGSFETKMFGWHGDLNAAQTAEIAAAKQVIYQGFKAAIPPAIPKAKPSILL